MSAMAGHILVVDDDPGHRDMLVALLRGLVASVTAAASAEEALEALEVRMPGLVLLDMRMPGIGGLGFLEERRRRGLAVPVVVVTAFAEVEAAVTAMKLGAADYLAKPIAVDLLEGLLERHLGSSPAAEAPSHPPLPPGVVCASPLTARLLGEAAAVARSEASVLLTGESGTGKEVVAGLIHGWSGRAAGPLVGVNAGAIPEGLLESELFGHEKGAFTGAAAARAGLLEQARGGTLFLDEIGDLPLALQPKLLRVLETGRLRRLGGAEEVALDLRLVAATNRDLEREVEAGRFRLDLYYRIAVFVIELPPLRERPEEILPLARAFLEAAGGRVRRFSRAAEQRLLAYPWPGNVRELRNTVQRAAILAAGEQAMPEHLPAALREAAAQARPAAPGGQPLAEIEREAILAALERCGGNRSRAARELGISRRKLLYRLKEYGQG